MLRSFAPLLLAAMLAGCASVSRGIETGADRTGRTLTRIGNRIEDGAESAGRTTRTLWQRIFGGGASSQSPQRKKSAGGSGTSTAPSQPAKFDTYTEEKIGN